ncbi:EamA family transporter [Glycomyces albidus]|jgi:drug/metabolite transporter (DMT)-like permease|uniref:EamA family transporter n=1 Tax=Glycomyces albidus TaxID=2656774 RepID=A0A6L5GDR1_9ACTN|nr:EamA family transporter [Glycomyces albidus]MQM27820.1 EamA family transporter [Glycomyces albidus]
MVTRLLGRTAVLSALMVVLLAAGWLLSGHLVAGVHPLAVAAGRTAASFAVLAALAAAVPSLRAGARTAAARPWAVAYLALLGFVLYYTGTLLGVDRIGASRVGLIVSLLPCITFAIGITAFGEKATARKTTGTLLAAAAAIAYAATGTGGTGLDGAVLAGAALAFGGTVAYALYGYVYRARLGDLAPPAALPAVTGAAALALGALAAAAVPLREIAFEDWVGIALLGAALTAPVFVLAHELILRRGPLYTSAVALLVPFLVRLGEWGLGWAGPPGPVALALLTACAAGVWLTVREPSRTTSGRRSATVATEESTP